MGKGESLEDLQAYYILLCIANMLTEISNSNAARFYTTETGRTSHNPGIFSAPPPGGTSTWPSWQWSFRSYPESQRTCPGCQHRPTKAIKCQPWHKRTPNRTGPSLCWWSLRKLCNLFMCKFQLFLAWSSCDDSSSFMTSASFIWSALTSKEWPYNLQCMINHIHLSDNVGTKIVSIGWLAVRTSNQQIPWMIPYPWKSSVALPWWAAAVAGPR